MWGLELQLTRPVDFGATRISVRPSASGQYTLKQRRRHTVSWICWPVLRRKHMTMVAAPSLHGEGVLALQQKFSKPSSSCWVEEAGTEKHDFSSKQPVCWFFFFFWRRIYFSNQPLQKMHFPMLLFSKKRYGESGVSTEAWLLRTSKGLSILRGQFPGSELT